MCSSTRSYGISLLIGTLLLILSACTSTQSMIRNEMKLRGEDSVTREGLVFKVRVIDEKAMKSDARLMKSVQFQKKLSSGQTVTVDGQYLLLSPPVFEITVTNNTGHVVRMKGAVMKLIDSANNLYDPLSKEMALAKVDEADAVSARKGIFLTPASSSQVRAGVRQLKMLEPNTELLPDFTETYLLAFQLPFEAGYEEMNKWLSNQTTLTLKIFEVAAETDQAGNVTRRVRFDFPLTVDSYNDIYEVSLSGTRLLRSEPIAKP